MFVYEKRLQYPVKIKRTNPKLAKLIIAQYGGAYFKYYEIGIIKSSSNFLIKKY